NFPSFSNFSKRPLVGAPDSGSASLFQGRRGQLPVRALAVLPPVVQLPIAPCRFSHGQRHHPRGRPTHPTPLTALRHTPIVDLLHPGAGEPEPRLLPRPVVRQVGPALLQIADQAVDPVGLPRLVAAATQPFDRRLHSPL